VFDCLYGDGEDLRREVLSVRRNILSACKTLPPLDGFVRNLAEDGMKAFQVETQRIRGCCRQEPVLGLCGETFSGMAQNKVNKEEEFVIGGSTGRLVRGSISERLLPVFYDGNKLRYVGKSRDGV